MTDSDPTIEEEPAAAPTRPRLLGRLRPARHPAGAKAPGGTREEAEAEAADELERAIAAGEPPELARRAAARESDQVGMHRRYRFQFEEVEATPEPAEAP